MNNTQITSTGSFLFKISVINALAQLKASFKHNRREIQKELGAKSHIDVHKICLNYPLTEYLKTDDLIEKVKDSIEVLFSIPLARHNINADEYFKDCLEWTIEQFSPAFVLTADVHLDEATPHMHVILSCVTPNKLIGSKIKGNKASYQERTDHFFHNVACKYGLHRPPTKLLKGD